MRLGKISIFLGVLSLIYYICAVISKISFASFFQIVGILLIAIGLLKIYVKPKTLERFRYIILCIKILCLVFIISFFSIEGILLLNSEKGETQACDYMVVLGAMVRNETPSMILQERLDAALPYVMNNPNTKIILSGGQGPGEKISEAEAMYRYFISKGVSEDRLLKEEKSTNTFENIKNSKKLIDEDSEKKVDKVIIVSSDFHIFRAKFLAERNGLKAYGIPANTYFAIKPTYYIREYFAVIKSFLFDRG